MNPLHIDFQELYRRHLCRHSQFGINVLHLIGVAGIYVALYAIAFALPGSVWIIGIGLGTYFGLLAFNIPLRLLLANICFIALLLALYLALPQMSVWVYVITIFVWHRFQIWNHKIYGKHHDMDEFEGKYQKGPQLFALLSIYELPILLNYLVFDRRSWTS
jgi:hypothetical protein